MSATYNTYERLIRGGRIQGMAEKLDAMLGYNRLTLEEYDDLMAQLNLKLQ